MNSMIVLLYKHCYDDEIRMDYLDGRMDVIKVRNDCRLLVRRLQETA
jgi:hypothetical protein